MPRRSVIGPFAHHRLRFRVTFAAVPVVLMATLTCPLCGHVAVETMPVTYCQKFYDCRGCGAVLKAAPGVCCVYCSYSDQLCPPQQEKSDCRNQS